MPVTIEEMAIFCKKKGFVFPNSEIYSGMSGFFDYGPLGVELKNNLKREWWKAHVHQREDMVGLDGAIITSQKVWVASGHVAMFSDVLLECPKCHNRVRADHYIESVLKIQAESLTPDQIAHMVKEKELLCPKCKTPFEDAKPFNLMFKTFVGPNEDSAAIAYLRPETAQLIFADFKLIQETSRKKLPFGVAQIGKAFRNEISPRDFLFRCREFEQMEIEYFVNPNNLDNCPYLSEVINVHLNVMTADMQEKKKEMVKLSIKECLARKVIGNPWHAYWLAFEHQWLVSLGANPSHLRIRQHLKDEKSHYAVDTWDLEFKFPFGWKELQGIANRGDFDLQQHIKTSGKDLSYFDEETKQKVVPHVIAEPSMGIDRTFLLFLFDAYNDDKERGNVVLKLNPKIAPFKAAVFPLLSNKEELVKLSKKVYQNLRSSFPVFYDQSGSIGRRYARQDEVGTPFCVTVDFDSLVNNDVTIRDRDTTNQRRVKIEELSKILEEAIKA
ncbi:MAG: glycine--tRNA ligase [Nanoarchaeota archaeon]|nr:MAG: glycine--tRNA ligase [Nanoarchaeota archaeon]